MAANTSVIVEGVLKSDGTLELHSRPPLPPGRVRIKLERVPEAGSDAAPLPDPPWPEDSVSAPFDLPLPHPPQPVEAREVAELLPDPFEWTEEAARP